MRVSIVFAVVLILLGVSSCGEECDPNRQYVGKDYRSYCSTPAWDLVKSMQYNKLKSAEEIIHSNPDLVNYQHPEYGNSLLFWATLNSNSKAVNLLLQNGAKVEKLNRENTSPIELASFNYTDCKSKILDSLIQYLPKDTNKSRLILNKALIGASSQPCLRKMKLLIKAGATPNFKHTGNFKIETSPLSEAAIQKRYHNLDYLLNLEKVDLEYGTYFRSNGDTLTLKQLLLEDLEEEHLNQEKTRRIILSLIEKINSKSSAN